MFLYCKPKMIYTLIEVYQIRKMLQNMHCHPIIESVMILMESKEKNKLFLSDFSQRKFNFVTF